MTDEPVPFLDLARQTETLWDELMTAIQDVVKSGRFILGPQVAAFEKEAAEYLGVKYAIGVNSGTDALLIALRAVGVEEGDEVISTPFSFFATTEVISHLGARPVLVDIEPETFNLDTTQVAEHITEHTTAILPVHLFGQSVGMDPLLELAQAHDLPIIEDTAQAFGAEYRGRKLGTLGTVGCFSFFPTKPLGGFGDGGLIVTNNDEVADTAYMLRAHGGHKKYYNEEIGYNSRLDALQAAILRVKLPYLDQWNEGRREAARRYTEMLEGQTEVVAPSEQSYAKHVYHQYTVRILNGKRNVVRERLAEQYISAMTYYPVPIHKLPVYEGQYGPLPAAEQAAEEVLSLPIWPEIDERTQARVVEALECSLE